MGKILKIMLATFGVCCFGLSIYFLINVITMSEQVQTTYEEMTGKSLSTAETAKFVFLREYTNSTGDKSLMLKLGISEKDAIAGGIIDHDPGTGGDDDPNIPEIDLCNCTENCVINGTNDDCPICTEDPSDCAIIPDCTCTGGFHCAPGNVQDCDACEIDTRNCHDYDPNQQTTYTRLAANGLWYVPQTSALWGRVDHGDANHTKWAKDMCAMIAYYSAARNCGYTDEDMGQLVARVLPSISIAPDGILEGTQDGVGFNATAWKAMANDIGMPYTDLGRSGSDYPTAPGDYLMYYSHSSRWEKNNKGSTINAHWIYVHIDSSGTARIANPGSEGDTYSQFPGRNYLIRCYSIP